MTDAELEIHYLWLGYYGLVESLGLKPTIQGFIKFRRTRWTKETCTPELVQKRAKECEEAAK